MGRYRRSFPQRVGGLVDHFLEHMDSKGSRRLVRLWRNWGTVLPPEIAKLARPLGHRGTTLLLTSDDPVVTQELSYFSDEILSRVNGFLGQEVFDKVRFELLEGRVPLDGKPERAKAPTGPLREKPSNLGAILEEMDQDTPLGKCYRAYLGLFRK